MLCILSSGCKYRNQHAESNDEENRLDTDYFQSWFDQGYLIHFEHDGSLNEDGVECISQPCTLKFHQEKMDWKRICEKLRSQGYKSHDTENCGLHVHMSRSALSPLQIVKMDVFINRAQDFWSQIGRRREIYNGSYEKGKPISGLDSNREQSTAIVFHCGTKVEGDKIVTSGGRVLSVTGMGATLREAVDRAYEGVKKISFEGMFYRKDIAHRAFER